jgi:hypothetical protein
MALGVAAAVAACTTGLGLIGWAARKLGKATDPLLEPIWWWFEWPG